MSANNICKFIELISSKGAGKASVFVAYQPKKPDSLYVTEESYIVKNNAILEFHEKISSFLSNRCK